MVAASLSAPRASMFSSVAGMSEGPPMTPPTASGRPRHPPAKAEPSRLASPSQVHGTSCRARCCRRSSPGVAGSGTWDRGRSSSRSRDTQADPRAPCRRSHTVPRGIARSAVRSPPWSPPPSGRSARGAALKARVGGRCSPRTLVVALATASRLRGSTLGVRPRLPGPGCPEPLSMQAQGYPAHRHEEEPGPDHG